MLFGTKNHDDATIFYVFHVNKPYGWSEFIMQQVYSKVKLKNKRQRERKRRKASRVIAAHKRRRQDFDENRFKLYSFVTDK